MIMVFDEIQKKLFPSMYSLGFFLLFLVTLFNLALQLHLDRYNQVIHAMSTVVISGMLYVIFVKFERGDLD